MFALFGVSLQEWVVLAGIGVPTAVLSVAVAFWLEARSSRGGWPGPACDSPATHTRPTEG